MQVQNSLEMLLKEASLGGNLEATIVRLQLDLERAQFSHQKEMAEMKRTLEMRQATAEADKRNILAEAQRHFEIEKHRAVDEAKKKQWCAQCSQEAIFYCCWNTAYCDYPCQQSHWPKHMVTCANANQNVESSQENAASPVPDGITRAPSPQKPLQVNLFCHSFRSLIDCFSLTWYSSFAVLLRFVKDSLNVWRSVQDFCGNSEGFLNQQSSEWIQSTSTKPLFQIQDSCQWFSRSYGLHNFLCLIYSFIIVAANYYCCINQVFIDSRL